MRAAVFEQLGQPLRVQTVADPTPAAHEVIVQVCHCGICGSDLHMTEDLAFGLHAGDIIGHEFAGEIVAKGKDVTQLRVGERVCVIPY